jgi:hypothetical protein
MPRPNSNGMVLPLTIFPSCILLLQFLAEKYVCNLCNQVCGYWAQPRKEVEKVRLYTLRIKIASRCECGRESELTEGCRMIPVGEWISSLKLLCPG